MNYPYKFIIFPLVHFRIKIFKNILDSVLIKNRDNYKIEKNVIVKGN